MQRSQITSPRSQSMYATKLGLEYRLDSKATFITMIGLLSLGTMNILGHIILCLYDLCILGCLVHAGPIQVAAISILHLWQWRFLQTWPNAPPLRTTALWQTKGNHLCNINNLSSWKFIEMSNYRTQCVRNCGNVKVHEISLRSIIKRLWNQGKDVGLVWGG